MHADVERKRAVGCTVHQIIDVSFHRTDVVLEALALGGEARENEAAIFADARRLSEAKRITIEIFAAAFRYRHVQKASVGIVGPAVIAADQTGGMTLAFVDHLGAAMGAAVEKDMHVAVTVARHDHRLAAELGRDVVAWIRYLAGMPDEQPGAAENALHLQLEDVSISVNAPMHTARLDKFGYVIRIAVDHGFIPQPDGRGSGLPD